MLDDCSVMPEIPDFLFPSFSFRGWTLQHERCAVQQSTRMQRAARIRLKKSRPRPIRGLLTPRWMVDEMERDWVESTRVESRYLRDPKWKITRGGRLPIYFDVSTRLFSIRDVHETLGILLK